MSIQAVAWAISQRVGSPTGKVLLICLANYANENGECWPSQKTISQEAELGERATRDWLKKLEEDGFIERRRRNRCDGSRTSDFIVLNLSRPPNSGTNTLPAQSAGRPIQPANGSKPTGTSDRTYRHDVPGNEPTIDPSNEPPTGARADGRNGFDEFWESWPEAERPKKRQAANWAFGRLSPDQQASAIKHARDYRRLAKARDEMALMIPYLKERQFEELEDAPEINADGRYVFTPERPEWPSWITFIEAKYSSKISERVKEAGTFIDTRKWPPRLPPSDGDRHHGV